MSTTTAIAVLISVLTAINLTTIIWQRIKAPDAARWAEYEAWRKCVDTKLDSDNRRINHLTDGQESNLEYQRVSLKTLKGITAIVAKNDDSGEARKLISEIDEFLIRR